MISSPSKLSTPSSSRVDRKIDMLFKGSSPNTVPDPTEALEAAKMGLYMPFDNVYALAQAFQYRDCPNPSFTKTGCEHLEIYG